MSDAAKRSLAHAGAAASGALATLHRHPRHLVLAALVAGLLAAPLAPVRVLLLALAAASLADRPPLALLAAGAVLGGALGAQARLAALERTQLPPLIGTTVTASVVLLEQPRPIRYGATALAELRAPVAGERIMLRIGQDAGWPAAPTGAVIAVRGRLRALGPFESHYARRGAHAALSLEAAGLTSARRGGPMGLVDAIRTRAERALDTGLPPPQAALLRGMTLGQDDRLDARTREDFRTSSLAHVLAASGQNVALLLALALPLLAYAGIGLRGRLTGSLALIALYVPLARFLPSDTDVSFRCWLLAWWRVA